MSQASQADDHLLPADERMGSNGTGGSWTWSSGVPGSPCGWRHYMRYQCFGAGCQAPGLLLALL